MNRQIEALIDVLGNLVVADLPITNIKRFGSINDGGYLLVDDLTNEDFLVSFGVGDNVDFEKDLLKYCRGSFLFDHSINELPQPLENATFFKEAIGGKPNLGLSDVLSRIPDCSRLLLKMDIEGSEWDFINESTVNDLSKFRQIVIEFHDLSKIDEEDFADRAKAVLSKLSSLFWILNIHANNNANFLIMENVPIPDVIEITFLNKTFYSVLPIKSVSVSKKIVDSLNSPCNPEIPEILFDVAPSIEKLSIENRSIGKVSVKELDRLLAQNNELTHELNDANAKIESLRKQRDDLLSSSIWRVTKPLRSLIEFYKSIRSR